MARLFWLHAFRATPTTMAPGQSRRAWAVGMPDRTPNFRAAYDAEVTTPRPCGEPPTSSSSALPAPSGSVNRATCT